MKEIVPQNSGCGFSFVNLFAYSLMASFFLMNPVFHGTKNISSRGKDDLPEVPGLECLRDGFLEHPVLVDGGHPVGVGRGVVVAATVPVALNKRPGSTGFML